MDRSLKIVYYLNTGGPAFPSECEATNCGACVADPATPAPRRRLGAGAGVTIPPWHEEPIAKRHNRDAFDCGDAALNEFLRRYARQAHDHGGAKTFLAVPDADAMRILGFYSLSSCLGGVFSDTRCHPAWIGAT